jgi:hypothetical protein
VDKDVAFSASVLSASLVDNLLDWYKPHMEKMAWQQNRAIAKITQLETLTRIARKSCKETLFSAWTSRKVAKANDAMMIPRSYNFSAFKRNRRFASFTFSLFGLGGNAKKGTELLMNNATNKTRHAKYLQLDDELHIVDPLRFVFEKRCALATPARLKNPRCG